MNKLYFGDCLDVLKELHKKHPEGIVDLMYIDPPFNSKRNYNILFEDVDLSDTKAQREAFSDTWSNVTYHDTLSEIQELDLDLYKFLKALDDIRLSKSAISYLTTMAIRLWYIHKVLKNTGSFYLHCDPTMSHYLKLVCDLIFGQRNFQNEIIWRYRGGGISKARFGQKHDIILFYTNSINYFFNPEAFKQEYSEETKKRMRHFNQAIRNGKGYEYNLNDKGKYPDDVWDDINIINPASKERLGYPTQKPAELMERIIQASSNEGDLVADMFCGCGTTIAAAQKLNRRWLGADISHLAIKLITKRLTDPYDNEDKKREILSKIEISGFPKDIASARELASHTDKHRIKFQDWVIEYMLGGISNIKKSGDGGFDGYLTFHTSQQKEKGIGIIEVKSGNVGIATLRSFIHVVENQKADMGIFVCFDEQVTDGMRIAANKIGKIVGWSSDKIQILTIEELLGGKKPQLPGGGTMKHFEESNKKLDKDKEEDRLF